MMLQSQENVNTEVLGPTLDLEKLRSTMLRNTIVR
jgi:hypothetical protein